MFNKMSKNDARIKRHVRVRGKISGTASCPRVSVYRSNKNISVQVINDELGVTLASMSSVNLGIKGENVEGAKQVGAALAKILVEKGITKVVFDRSGYIYHGRVEALANALRDGKIEF